MGFFISMEKRVSSCQILKVWSFYRCGTLMVRRQWVSENSQKSCAAVRQYATLIQTTDRWNNQIHNVDERENFFDMTNQFLKEGCQSGVKQDDTQGQSISAAVSQSASVYPHRLSAGW